MKIARSQLNEYALKLEDAQTEIREIVKYAFLSGELISITSKKILDVINKAVKPIVISRLKVASKRSLINFANAQINGWRALRLTPAVLAYLGQEASKGFTFKHLPNKKDLAVLGEIKALKFPAFDKGIPLSRYYKDVWEQSVKPQLDRLAQGVALDPNDFTGRNSLRNLAEMEVRYKGHQDEIADLKIRGVKLVIASTHGDCSGRCAPWQGRVYSLDGSYGTTDDGRKYVPLEEATDVYYTTKAGITYKNGLLGFNCRHKLYEYQSGMRSPTVTAKERKQEYAITLKQRELERAVRKKKVEALMLKDINKAGYQKAKAEAKALYERYKEYSHENERAYYPMRVSI
jgi:hypothetical protein